MGLIFSAACQEDSAVPEPEWAPSVRDAEHPLVALIRRGYIGDLETAKEFDIHRRYIGKIPLDGGVASWRSSEFRCLEYQCLYPLSWALIFGHDRLVEYMVGLGARRNYMEKIRRQAVIGMRVRAKHPRWFLVAASNLAFDHRDMHGLASQPAVARAFFETERPAGAPVETPSATTMSYNGVQLHHDADAAVAGTWPWVFPPEGLVGPDYAFLGINWKFTHGPLFLYAIQVHGADRNPHVADGLGVWNRGTRKLYDTFFRRVAEKVGGDEGAAMITKMVKAGVNMNWAPSMDDAYLDGTALHLAAYGSNGSVVEALLALGASPFIRCESNGKRALDMARDAETAKMLQESMTATGGATASAHSGADKENCARCRGTGEEEEECDVCYGRKNTTRQEKRLVTRTNFNGVQVVLEEVTIKVRCWNCQGEGKETIACPACKGKGHFVN